MNKLIASAVLVAMVLLLGAVSIAHPTASAQYDAGLPAFRFVSWSDIQDQGSRSPTTAAKISALNPTFTIVNGDFSDDGVVLDPTSNDSMQWMANAVGTGLFSKTFLHRGNHDNHYSNPADWQSFFSSYPEGQGTMADRVTRIGGRNYNYLSGQDNLTYSFDYGNSRFIMVDDPGSISSVTPAAVTWIDQRLTEAESSHPELVHAFISFHGALYCVSYHCSCAGQRAGCQGSIGNSLVDVINRHPIVTATFNGHEHNLGWTHLDSTRISTLTHPIEQFMTAPGGQGTYNSYVQFDGNSVPYRFDYVETSIEDQAFGVIDVDGTSFTVSLYRESRPAPVWSQTFTKSGPGPTSTPAPASSSTPTPARTPGFTSTVAPTPGSPTLSPTPSRTFTITPTPGAAMTLVGRGSTWKYLDTGTNQGTAWRDLAFQDSGWATGPGKLGYSSNNAGFGTVVSYGPDPANKYITTYFRKAFTVSNPGTIAALNLGLLRDDGAVVYLNGIEVYRNNMPGGAVTYITRASTTVDDGNTYYPASVDPALLVAGTNVIAAEMHQVSPSSSDLSFDAELTAALSSGGSTPTQTATPTLITTPALTPAVSSTPSRTVTAAATPTGGAGAGPIAWAEDAMTWIFKTDPVKTNPSITLFSARREYEPFQIAVRAPAASNLTDVNVVVSDLVGPNNASISADNVNLYREYYVSLPYGSAASTGTNRPMGPGLYPDGLIPFRDPDTHQDLTGGIYDAAPFSVNAGENQPVFVDIFTPPGTPAGQYHGTATITSSTGTSTIDITLNVWDFTLPLVKSLHAYSMTDPNLRDNLANYKELLRHGLNPKYVDPADEQYLMDNFGLDRVSVFSGSGSSYRHCYTNNPVPNPADVAAEAARHRPGLYLYDEYANEIWPCTDNITSGFYLDWANALRQGGVRPHIVTYPVASPAPGLLGTAPDYQDSAGDEWSILPKHYDAALSNIQLLMSKGVEMWSYNPLTQDNYSPKFTVDYLPVNSRIMQGFINQSIGFVGSKFWRVDYWTADPWNAKNQYDQETGSLAPGEGDMTYRGLEAGLPADRIIAGMRLKWFREGVEDYEYAQILKSLGQTQFAMDTIHTVATDFHTWSQDKNALYSARQTLGDRISSLARTGTPTSTATSTPSPTYTHTATYTAARTTTTTVTHTPTLTRTATGTPTPLPPTSAPTNTPVPPPPTATSSNTPVPPTGTRVGTNTHTSTPLPTNTRTRTPTNTPLPSNTPTSAPTNTTTATTPPVSTPTGTPAACQAVGWTNYVNVEIMGNSIQKVSGASSSWDAGADSTQYLVAGDGSVEATVDDIKPQRMMGLSFSDTGPHHTNIDFAAYLAGSRLYVYEHGVNKGAFGDLRVGDRVKVAVERGVVKYYVNSARVYTSAQAPRYPMWLDAAIKSRGGRVADAFLCGTVTGTTAAAKP